jgi:phosphate/sulfate permease
MYYNRILRVWVLDPLDYFLISAFVGSLLASHLKNYLSEKSSMERLKNSIINKSNLATKTSTLILNSKKEKNL